MRSVYKFLPFFALFVLLTPSLALAVSCSGPCDYVWHGIFGFQNSWLNEPKELIINIFIPCAAMYIFTLGLIRATGISNAMGNIEHGIAIIVMLAGLFTGGVGAYNTWALVVMGQFAFWGYVIIFLVAGGFFFAVKYLKAKRGWRSEKDIDNTYKRDMESFNKNITAAEALLGTYKDNLLKCAKLIPSKNGKALRQVDSRKANDYRKKIVQQEIYIQQLYEAEKKLADTYKVTKAV